MRCFLWVFQKCMIVKDAMDDGRGVKGLRGGNIMEGNYLGSPLQQYGKF